MATLNVGGKELPLDEDGYLQDRSLWSKEAAEAFAAQDGITLTDEHWEIINFLREYFEEHHFEGDQIAPALRALVKDIKEKFGEEKGNLKYVHKLFPEGPAKQGCKYAGLPMAKPCC